MGYVLKPDLFETNPKHWKSLTMSVFERTKHCTKRFPCRFKLALMVFSVALAASIAAVPFIPHTI
jgi:hypothetical protein